jgi:hypothetical protein
MLRSELRLLSLAVPTLFILACGKGSSSRAAQSQSSASLSPAPSLGSAASFSVLGGETVTNVGPSTLSGDLGVSPGSATTGFPPGQLIPPAKRHAADTEAAQAQSDVGAAYDLLASAKCTADMSGKDLGARTLSAGVYCFSSETQLTGTLVLDAKFQANALFVFKMVSKLTAAGSASVRLINGAKPCNVFWIVGSSATIGTNASFAGNILALTSIALKSGASLNGRALARRGEVTLSSNRIRSEECQAEEGGEELACCSGAKACNGACSDLTTDANNCGACGKSCAASQVCTAGACAACPQNRTQCQDQCADLQFDPFNCGACGKVCAASESCLAGACGACDGTVCDNTCVELRTDSANCGACGKTCAEEECCNAGSCSTKLPNGDSCKKP